MKTFRKLMGLLLCAAFAFSLFGCSQEPAATNPPATEPPPTEPSAAVIYAQAIQPIENAQNLELELTTQKEITVGEETFRQTSEQELVLSGIGTGGLQAALSEDMELETLDDAFDEYYAEGILYTTVADTYHFKGAMTQDAFLARFAPAVLLDGTLYAEITLSEESGGTLITFASPSAGESWALPEGAELISASGTALIGTDGVLDKSTYSIEYIHNSIRVQMEITSDPEIPESVTLTPPAEDVQYTELRSIEIPRIYDLAVMHLCSTTRASSTLTETIISQAAAYTHTEQTTLDFFGTGSEHAANVDYTITAYQDGAGTNTYSQNEHFQNGTYTFTADGVTEEDSEVTADVMYEYLQGMLNENILALDYLATAEAEDVGGLTYLNMGLTDEYGELLNGYVCSMLFDDSELLNNMASAYVTDECSHYMFVDPATGFPLSLGIQYSGTHTIDGEEYTLAVQADQSFRLASTAAYESVTGETLPEETPEKKATPLFYHVTGADGQQMWMLGTIHIGDARTAYLPQEVYTALDASDALAVEADIIAFEEQMTTDSGLATEIAMLYVNSDGSATKDQLDEAVYEKAVKLLKTGGSYNANMEYMKPFLWSQSIDNFYLQLDPVLESDKGMDARLLKLAKEQEKQILEVESGMFQMQMFSEFSQPLQVLLLEQSIETTAAEYCADAHELYELWCQGDEAALREVLEEDLSDLTEEEKPLYDEYLNAMIIERNDAMLDVATGYLESGDTVFFAVGLAHLLQENGLVDTLRDAGYTVELVEYAR